MLEGPPRAQQQRVDFAKLPKLADSGAADLSKSFGGLAKALEDSGEVAQVQVDVLAGRKAEQWTLSLERKRAAASSGAASNPDLRLIVARDAWDAVAAGELSPVDAFLSGKLRVRGDVDLARRLLKRAGGRGATDLPGGS
jgi:hypothetical protein